MKMFRLYEENPNEKTIREIAERIAQGEVCIYPSDTVYALGCSIHNKKALERVAAIKGVKIEKANFSIICANLSNLSDFTRQIDSTTFKMLKQHLPGPYTFILPASNQLPNAFPSKKKTIGIRVPKSNIARCLVEELGHPIVSTSIKDEDQLLEYSTDPELIFERFEHTVDIVIHGGSGGNIASTVIDLTGDTPVIVREGLGSTDAFILE